MLQILRICNEGDDGRFVNRPYDVYVIMVGDGAFDVPRITIEKRRAIHESALDNRE